MYKIYKITNLVNNKVYIGQTSLTVEERFRQHVYNSKNKHKKSLLYSSMKKYGVDKFLVEQIDSAKSQKEANDKEILWIEIYKTNHYKYSYNGYNMTDGGGGISGYQLSNEHKEKISKAMTGIVFTEERKRNISEGKKGYSHSEQTKQRISETKLANSFQHSEETKQHLKEINTGRKHSDKTIEKIRQSKLGIKRTEEQRKRISEGHIGQVPWNKGKQLDTKLINVQKFNRMKNRIHEQIISSDFLKLNMHQEDINKLKFLNEESLYNEVLSFVSEKIKHLKNQRNNSEDYNAFTKRIRRLKNDLKRIDMDLIKEVI